MGNVVADITVSLDGFVAGPNDGPGHGLGDGGEALHYWVFGQKWTYADEARGTLQEAERDPVDQQVVDEMLAGQAAAICGRGMFDAAGAWGYTNPFPFPVFVLTNRVDDELLEKASEFTFVTDGIESALEQAKAAAGDGRVGIVGGANVIQQYLAAGLVDELSLHIAPVTLGAGRRLFDNVGHLELEQTGAAQSAWATHLRYKVIK